ncbi:MAG: putative Zn finger protein [Myxococcota bacterium]|jgi:uncharacterized Zn finger protein
MADPRAQPIDTTDHTWSAAWLARVGEQGHAYADRLSRGPYYLARGALRNLEITPGRVSGMFLHGRQRSQPVSLDVAPLSDADWETLVHALAAELRFSAAIADGSLPPEALQLLRDAGVDLIGPRVGITETCHCTEAGADPCRHIATLHHSLGLAFDADPFQLLVLRGRDTSTLRASLRAARTGEDLATAARSPDAVAIDDLEGDDIFKSRGDLEGIPLAPRRVSDPAWLFEQLGEPPGIEDSIDLERLIVRAADTAWKLAAGDGSEAADTELLITELRAQRMSTPVKLAAALGWEPEVVAEALDDLYAENAVMRMGTGLDAKYRSAS